MIANPNYGATNFDNIMYSYLQVFICVTVEGWKYYDVISVLGWTEIMYFMVKAFSVITIPFFILIVFIGNFFLVNFTLAVIKLKFTQSEVQKVEEDLCKIK